MTSDIHGGTIRALQSLHKYFPGNRPQRSGFTDKLSPMGEEIIMTADRVDQAKAPESQGNFEFGHRIIDGEDWTVVAARQPYKVSPDRQLWTYTAKPGEHIIAQGIYVDAQAGSVVIGEQRSYTHAEPGSKAIVRNGGIVDVEPGSDVDVQSRGSASLKPGSSAHVGEGGTVYAGNDSEVDAGPGSLVFAGKRVHVIAGSGAYLMQANTDSVIDAQLGAHLHDVSPEAIVHAPRGIDLAYKNDFWHTVPDGAVVNTSDQNAIMTMAARGSVVTADDRSRVVAQSGSKVHAMTGSGVVATPGSEVVAEYAVTVLKLPGAVVQAMPGAIVVNGDPERYAGPQYDSRISGKSFQQPGQPDSKALVYDWLSGDEAPRGTWGRIAWGSIVATPGSHVVAAGESQVLAQADAVVEAQSGSKVDALSGSVVTARAYSEVTARPGSTVIAESDSVIKEEKGSHVLYEDSSWKRGVKDWGFGWVPLLTFSSPSEERRDEAYRVHQRNRRGSDSSAPPM
jgi:hypothetical protein